MLASMKIPLQCRHDTKRNMSLRTTTHHKQNKTDAARLQIERGRGFCRGAADDLLGFFRMPPRLALLRCQFCCVFRQGCSSQMNSMQFRSKTQSLIRGADPQNIIPIFPEPCVIGIVQIHIELLCKWSVPWARALDP